MKYWVYINDKVEGPFEEDNLVTLKGFTPETLICSEDSANSGNQEWVKASSIFEFDQVPAPAPAPAAQPVTKAEPVAAQPVAQPATAAVAQPAMSDELSAALLSKLDALTDHITGLQSQLTGMQARLEGMQNKLDGMQTKLDESIAQQQQAAASRTATLPNHFSSSEMPDGALKPNTITLTRKEVDSLQEEAQPEAQSRTPEMELGSAVEGAAVLNSALDAITSKQELEQQNLQNESTFQDLLTSEQAQKLAQQPQQNNQPVQSLDVSVAGAPKQQEQTKEDVLAEFTNSAAQSNAIDQLIEEKEQKKSMTIRLAEGAAAALAGAATFIGLKKPAEESAAKQTPAEEPVQPKPEVPAVPAEEPVIPAPAEEQAAAPAMNDLPSMPSDVPTLPSEKPFLDFGEETNPAPAMSIAPDKQEPEKLEEVLPAEQMPQDVAPMETPEVKPMDVTPMETVSTGAQDIAPMAAPTVKPQEQQPVDLQDMNDLPTLKTMGGHIPTAETTEQMTADETMQELIPDAKENTGTRDMLINAHDLNEAFADNGSNNDDNSVEQLFGLASASAAVDNTPQNAQAEENVLQEIPSLEPTTAKDPEPTTPAQEPATAEVPEPAALANAPAPANANELTEIELNEGSTYLISDFVPPAQADGSAPSVPAELKKADAEKKQEEGNQPETKEEKQETKKEEGTTSFEIQDLVSNLGQTEKIAKPEENPNMPADVTISQVILENTIRSKRGAALDIKTVPMVPEPAQTERLHLEGMDDDVTAQHDIKPSDVKPASKGTKAVVGMLIAIVLAGVLYAGLAFMNLLPPSMNFLSNKKAAAKQQAQTAQVEAMLGSDENVNMPSTTPVSTPVETTEAAAQTPADPMQAVLTAVQNYPLSNGYTLKEFIESKHATAANLITWDVSTAVEPDNYSILVKIPPENPQSFKISYRFNYNTVTQALEPTISDAKNLLDSVNQPISSPAPVVAQ